MKIWRKIIGSPIGKGTAVLLIINILSNILSPSVALALTGGPSQPEFQGFTEIGVNNMVDPFTGDFSYEIPLMIVPGPNGGYPINLNYVAGPGMEDEASWVGLGWSLNPGAINRNMRGIPDDFSGPQEENGNNLVNVTNSDKIVKSYFTKNNVTVGVGMGITLPPQPPEIAGIDMAFKPGPSGVSLSLNPNLYYNTYKGVGFRAGIGMKLSTVSNEGGSGGLSAGLNLNFDSNDGASVQPSISMSAGQGKSNASVAIGFNYNSRQGITNNFISTSYSRKFSMKNASGTKTGTKNISTGNSVSFAATTGVPSTSMAMFGVNSGFNLDFESGAFMTHLNIPVSFNGMFSVQKVKEWMQLGYGYPAYGTLYSGYRDNDDIQLDRALMDYNRENEVAINIKSPMLPMPVMTHDVYSVTGSQMGGSFRAFRNDAGTFYEPRTASDFLGVTIGVEVAAAPGFKVGVDPTVNFSHSYSGKWKVEDDIKQIKETNFFRKKSDLIQNGIRTVEPFDFRFTGELTAHHEGDIRFATVGGPGAGRYTLFPATDDFPDLSETEFEEPDAQQQMNKFAPFKNLGKFKAKASNKMNGQAIMAENTVRKFEERKVQLIQYRTKSEIQAQVSAGGEPFLPKVFVSNPGEVMPSKTAFNLAQPEIKGHHLTEFNIIQPGGMKYVYGLPLYNRTQGEYYFSIKPNYSNNGRTVEVPDLENLLNFERKGRHNDKFFTFTGIGPYAHSHLLTQIVSPDYIDVNNDGPSDEDYGYWTKFNYQTPKIYKWRTPTKQNTANYIKGFESNPNDQKGTVTYGERDMTYLHSIETKTHVAVFFLSDRDDALEVNGVAGGVNTNGNKMKKLESIRLYSKSDLNTPIKSVRFIYTYELCENIDNRGPSPSPFTHYDPNTGAPITENYRGKLTLKKIYFEYGNSDKGALTPYVFEYGKVYRDAQGANAIELVEDPGRNGNPDYLTKSVDRWGSYKEEVGLSNEDFPYVNQEMSIDAINRRLEGATAWNLTGITLPTGAKIKVAYEPDDYAYVQDKPATQMYRIAGMAKSLETNHADWLLASGDEAEITEEYKIILFHLDDINTSDEDVAKMVRQTPDGNLYFKTWQKLQIPKGMTSVAWANDYVTGYAPIETSSGFGTKMYGTKKYGYVTLKEVTDDSKNWNAFRKAGIQYLRYQRADLGMPQNQGNAALEAAAMILTAIPVIVQAIEMMTGFYNWSLAKGHCKYIANQKPSFIKMGIADGVKFGGGHRVRKITISDAWKDLTGDNNENEAHYGMEYFYHTTDAEGKKISSGVASYEPLIGGDENPMKKPHYYGPDSKHIHNDLAFYLEEPIGESYFPAPVVGYSKVTMVNLANRKNIKTGDGIQVREFYTAYDFPIKATYSQHLQRIEDKQTVFIPLIASITLKGYGYSQGYHIELNDMHGKPKSESVHDADYWNTHNKNWVDVEGDLPYVSKKTYHYKTSGKELDNTVEVLNGDGIIKSAIMGETSEMFSEMKEDFSYAFSAGAQVNGGVDPVPYGLFFSLMPNFTYDESSARILVTTKVVYKNGILNEIREMAEGAVKKTKNLLYDPETGQPLLTAITSDFDDAQVDQNDQNIYNYTYPAYWYYSGMQAAYRNYRNTYIFGGALTTSNFPDANKYFEPGDELMGPNGRVWVNGVSSTSVSFINSTGQFETPTGTYVTMRSGKRNLQNIPTGSLASLVNPTLQKTNSILNYYNENISDNPLYSSSICSNPLNFPITNLRDCADQSLVYNGVIKSACNSPSYGQDVLSFLYQYPGAISDCFINVFLGDLNIDNFIPANAQFLYSSENNAIMRYKLPSGAIVLKNVEIISKCKLKACELGVLNASADEFSNEWVYNNEFIPVGNSTFSNLNKYLKGELGIWRKLRTNAYFAERKQRSEGNTAGVYKTYIGQDGTYNQFVVFDWLKDINADNKPDGNKDNNQASAGWRWQAELTPRGYSPYGYEIENRNALNIYSSELYGYKNSLPTASAQNAAYSEISYDGFEEILYPQPYNKTGHMHFITTGTTASLSLVKGISHTGNQSLKITPGNMGWAYMTMPVRQPFYAFGHGGTQEFVNGKKYVVSLWYKFEGNPTSPSLELLLKNADQGGAPYFQAVHINTSSPAIEGWKRAEAIFSISDFNGYTLPSTLEFEILVQHPIFIDDIRIHPVDAPFESYVYDPKNFLLRATLDDNNYATFYNYDEENTLIQVKKETVEGIRTIQTTRKNVKIHHKQ